MKIKIVESNNSLKLEELVNLFLENEESKILVFSIEYKFFENNFYAFIAYNIPFQCE